MVSLRPEFCLLRRVALLVRRHWTLANRVHGQTPMPARVTASHILLVGNHRAQDIAFTTQCVARNRNGRYAI
jgi:hypothetical protein